MKHPPVRTLIIAPQWIGDAVMTQPLLAQLATQGQQLTVAALPWVAPVYRAMPHVAHVLELPFAHGGLQWSARRQIAKQIQGQFDRAYVLPNSFKSALLPWLAKIPTRIGYAGEMRLGILTHCLPNPSKQHRPPMVAHYSALANVATGSAAVWPTALTNPTSDTLSNPHPAPPQHPQLAIRDEAIALACQAHGLTRGAYYIFAPSAEYGPAKRWPATHFAQLSKLLGDPKSEARPLAQADECLSPQDQPHAATIVLLGSGKERELCEDIVQLASTATDPHPTSAQPSMRNLAGQTTLDTALALIAGAKAVISNDSGLMHVAAACQVPQVAVFGSSSPHHTPPLSNKARVIWLKDDPTYTPPLDCAPCFERTCRFGHTRCLQDIAPQRVQADLRAITA